MRLLISTSSSLCFRLYSSSLLWIMFSMSRTFTMWLRLASSLIAMRLSLCDKLAVSSSIVDCISTNCSSRTATACWPYSMIISLLSAIICDFSDSFSFNCSISSLLAFSLSWTYCVHASRSCSPSWRKWTVIASDVSCCWRMSCDAFSSSVRYFPLISILSRTMCAAPASASWPRFSSSMILIVEPSSRRCASASAIVCSSSTLCASMRETLMNSISELTCSWYSSWCWCE